MPNKPIDVLFEREEWTSFQNALARIEPLKPTLSLNEANYVASAEEFGELCTHIQAKIVGFDGRDWSLWVNVADKHKHEACVNNLGTAATVLNTLGREPLKPQTANGIKTVLRTLGKWKELLMTATVRQFARLARAKTTLEWFGPNCEEFNATVRELLARCVQLDNKPAGPSSKFSIWGTEFAPLDQAQTKFVFERAAAKLTLSLGKHPSHENAQNIIHFLAGEVINLDEGIQTAKMRYWLVQLGQLVCKAAEFGVDGGLGGVYDELTRLNPRPGQERTPWNAPFKSEHRVHALVALAQAAQQLSKLLDGPSSGVAQLEQQIVSRATTQKVAHTPTELETAGRRCE